MINGSGEGESKSGEYSILSQSHLFNRLFGLFGSILIVDCRESKEEYCNGHIPRAIHLSLNAEDVSNNVSLLDLVSRLNPVDKRSFNLRTRQSVLLYRNKYEENAEDKQITEYLYKLLMDEGRISSVSILSGGFNLFTSKYKFLVCKSSPTGLHTHLPAFPGYPSEIIEDFIYLGSHVDAGNIQHLDNLGIKNILNISTEVNHEYSEDKFNYLQLKCEDKEDTDIKQQFEGLFQFIDKAKENKEKILVHCHQGISRSATILLAYLMKEYNYSLVEAFNFIKQRRKQIMPNIGFWAQLSEFERVCASKNPNFSEFVSTVDECVNLKQMEEENKSKRENKLYQENNEKNGNNTNNTNNKNNDDNDTDNNDSNNNTSNSSANNSDSEENGSSNESSIIKGNEKEEEEEEQEDSVNDSTPSTPSSTINTVEIPLNPPSSS